MSVLLAIAICFQASGQDDLEKLKKKVTDLETEVEKLMEEKLDQAETAPAKTESANAFNPSITAFLNAAMRIDNHTVEAAGHDHGGGGSDSDLIDDRFWLRGAELDFRVRQVAAFEAGPGLLQKPLYRRIGLERLFFLALLFTPLLTVHRFIP